jgi:hypothetical protein
MKVRCENVTNEGALFVFDKPVSLHGGVATREWWLSWDKVCELLVRVFDSKEDATGLGWRGGPT